MQMARRRATRLGPASMKSNKRKLSERNAPAAAGPTQQGRAPSSDASRVHTQYTKRGAKAGAEAPSQRTYRRLDGAKGVVLSRHAQVGKSVEKGGLSNVGQPHDAHLQRVAEAPKDALLHGPIALLLGRHVPAWTSRRCVNRSGAALLQQVGRRLKEGQRLKQLRGRLEVTAAVSPRGRWHTLAGMQRQCRRCRVPLAVPAQLKWSKSQLCTRN